MWQRGIKFGFKSKMHPRQGCEYVLLPDTRFSYLPLWDQVGCSPRLGHLKQLLCIGPHLLWLSTKYICTCAIFIWKQHKTKHTHPLPNRNLTYQGAYYYICFSGPLYRSSHKIHKISFRIGNQSWSGNLKSPHFPFSYSGHVKLLTATHC